MGWGNSKFFGVFALNIIVAGAPASAQDLARAREDVKVLAAPAFYGRGYLRDGMARAAEWIAGELRSAGIAPLADGTYFQEFHHSINTFPGKVEVRLNGRALRTGVDYIVTADSTGRRAQAALHVADKDLYLSADKLLRVRLVDKLTFAARQKERVQPWTEIQLDRKRFTSVPSQLNVDIESRLVGDFTARNVTAIVRGTRRPDRYLVLSAHYDHLGGLGSEAYFPGANDNASGTAFLLDLARHYQAHPLEESVVFLFFGSEEAGLVGSKHFVAHPQIPLDRIRLVTNFDMVGTGDDGATVVNATVYREPFAILRGLNDELRALPRLNERGEAANSDHHPFHLAGVPSFFLYTTGGIAAYHDVDDRAETLPFTRYNELFKLITRYLERLDASGRNDRR